MPHRDPIDTSRQPLTKILSTLGPATDSPEVLAKLVEHGSTLFRLNFSHGTFDDHGIRLKAVRDLAARMDCPLAVLADLPGPKIRLGQVPGEGIELCAGQDVLLRGDIEACCEGEMPTLACNYQRVAVEVDPGNRVLINDGAVRLLAVVTDGEQLLCRVTQGGTVTSRKGVNLPDSDLSVPATTPRDLEIVDWSAANGIDFLALSFVRKADELMTLHQRLHAACSLRTGPKKPSARIPLIAKIETPQAVTNIESILEVADGLMVARGDLGVELELARVPVVQKELMRAARAHGKPCIVATQMLETMIHSPVPTRAEVSDVANAVMDGADALMLSGETAAGRYPVLAVEMMRRVIQATEPALGERHVERRAPPAGAAHRSKLQALAHGAWHMARDVGASIAVVWSQDGEAARYLSQVGFRMPIVAFTSDPATQRRMGLYFAVVPVLMKKVPVHRTEMARQADAYILERGLAQSGDRVVLIGGKPFDDPGSVNTVAIRTVGELAVAH